MTTVSNKAGAGEIACQQVLLQDGSIYSVQWLVVPERSAHLVSAEFLLQRYLQHVRTFTLSLVRPVINEAGVQFLLIGTSLAFLSFAPPDFTHGPQGEAVHLRNIGGLLVQGRASGGGVLSFLIEREGDGLRITMQLLYSRPLLLGSGNPSALRRLFFSLTQGHLHRVITVRYLTKVYRELTGDKVRLRVRQVRVREGIDI
jgi:hypothetical protein